VGAVLENIVDDTIAEEQQQTKVWPQEVKVSSACCSDLITTTYRKVHVKGNVAIYGEQTRTSEDTRIAGTRDLMAAIHGHGCFES